MKRKRACKRMWVEAKEWRRSCRLRNSQRIMTPSDHDEGDWKREVKMNEKEKSDIEDWPCVSLQSRECSLLSKKYAIPLFDQSVSIVPIYQDCHEHLWQDLILKAWRNDEAFHKHAKLNSEDLWYDFFAFALNQEIADEMLNWFAQCADDELDFKKCMKLILKYFFVDAKTKSSLFWTHFIFHRVFLFMQQDI